MKWEEEGSHIILSHLARQNPHVGAVVRVGWKERGNPVTLSHQTG
jgi:predicted FMN-binding regulatory protein PaiB